MQEEQHGDACFMCSMNFTANLLLKLGGFFLLFDETFD